MNLEGKIVFIAGAITGVTDYKEQFTSAEKNLQEQGATVINPAVLPPGLKWADYLRITKEMLQCADVVYVLPCWATSKGVLEELEVARKQDKEIIYAPTEAVEYTPLPWEPYVMSPFRAIQALGDMKEQFEAWDDVAALDMACRAIQYCWKNQPKQRI